MKRFFTFIAGMVTAVSSMAADYTAQMSISLNGDVPTAQEATVSAVRTEDGDNIYYEITLNQFSFSGMEIGDVTISGVEAYDTEDMDGYSFFIETTQEAGITNGGTIAMLLGGKVTVTIKEGSCVNDDNLYLDLNLPVTIMGSTINVDATFGTKPSFPTYYSDQLVVTLAGTIVLDPQDAVITVTDEGDGKYTLTLKNFSLTGLYDVGTIEVTGVEGTEDNGMVKLQANQTVTIQPGDDSKAWIMAGQEIPVNMTGEMTDDKLYVKINIEYEGLLIDVVFGSEITSGISKIVTGKGTDTIYDVDGRKTGMMRKGLNIVRKADGTTIKVVKK